MSTEPSIKRTDAAAPDIDLPKRFHQKTAGQNQIPEDLLSQTREQIRQRVTEIRELAQSDVTNALFFEGFLARVTNALASIGGAIWLKPSSSNDLNLEYQINAIPNCLSTDKTTQEHHRRLLAQLRDSAEATLIPPHTGNDQVEGAINPTDALLIIAPIILEQEVIGLVEIFQRTGAGPTTQRGYLRFVVQMCELATEFLKNRQRRSLAQQTEFWGHLEQFIQTVHRDLDTESTLFTIANEGRRIIGCDRLSIALQQGNESRIQVVSGLDSIERRADQIKKLNALATAVNKIGEPFWQPDEHQSLPPQIGLKLESYIATAHPKRVAVIPLRAVPDSSQLGSQPGHIIGALIIEQMQDQRIDEATKKRVDAILEHSATAITNAIRYNNVFLLPLWEWLGKLTTRNHGNHRSRALRWLGGIACVLGFLCVFPFPFTIGSSGQLMPQSQHEVFAQVDGILQEVYVSEDNLQKVQAGQVLAKMSNNDLMVEIQNLQGQINQTREQRRKFERAMHEKMAPIDDIMIEGERIKTEQAEISLNRQLKLKLEQAKKLEVVSPALGRIVNWKVRQNLLRRPVEKGQSLMTIIDPNTTWQLELEIPERRIGHLMRRLIEGGPLPTVQFTLASFPGQKFQGTLKTVDQKMEVYSDTGNAALAVIEFDNSQVPQELLRPGTRVNANIHCGTESIGYVWFHELLETTQSAWMRWF